MQKEKSKPCPYSPELLELGLNKAKIEQLADTEHERWADWMKYQFTRIYQDKDGRYIIPQEWASRWLRQSVTPYAELSEREKQSDRQQVLRYMKILNDK